MQAEAPDATVLLDGGLTARRRAPTLVVTMLRDARRCGPRGLVLACLGVAACTGKDPPAQEPAAAVEHVVPALPPQEPTEPAKATADPIAPSLATHEAPRPTPRCSLAAPKGAPEQALAAVIAELPVEPSFVCPATYRLVQRQGPYHTYVGTDAATGDRVWIKLVHDRRAKADERVWGYRPKEYDAQCDVRGPMPAGWFCVRASARTHAGAAPLQAWLTAHSDVDAVDWISFELNPHDAGSAARTGGAGGAPTSIAAGSAKADYPPTSRS